MQPESATPIVGAQTGNIITHNSLSVYGGGVLCPSPSTATGFFNPRQGSADLSALDLPFPRTMALVAQPPPPHHSAWSSHIPASMTGNNNNNNGSSSGISGGTDDLTSLGPLVPPLTKQELLQQQQQQQSNGHTTSSGSSMTPNSQANSTQSGSSGSQLDVKPNQQNVECVVCGDKSSGKHYGQFTCEGKEIFVCVKTGLTGGRMDG